MCDSDDQPCGEVADRGGILCREWALWTPEQRIVQWVRVDEAGEETPPEGLHRAAQEQAKRGRHPYL